MDNKGQLQRNANNLVNNTVQISAPEPTSGGYCVPHSLLLDVGTSDFHVM